MPSDLPKQPTRARIIRAALELFTAQGYAATTTKQISTLAGVAEPTVFRQFGSKAELFEATVSEPFAEFVARWREGWGEVPEDASFEEMARRLVAGLSDLVRRDRRLLQDLIAARWDPNNDLHASAVTISADLRQAMRVIHDAGVNVAETDGIVGVDAPTNIGVFASMVIGSILLEDWVYPAGIRMPGSRRITDEIAALALHGILHRADPDVRP